MGRTRFRLNISPKENLSGTLGACTLGSIRARYALKDAELCLMTNAQRALWTFLLYTLIGPFLAAVAVLVGSTAMGLSGLLPATASAAGYALQAFVLGAFIAAIGGAGLAALTSLRGGFGWLEAAIAGVLGFMAVALGSGAVASSHLTVLAFLAACVALACRAILVRIRILPGT
jgi:hypothetical protein